GLVRRHGYRGPDQCRDGIELAGEHGRDPADEHVPDGAAADSRDGAADHRLPCAETELERLAGAGDGEKAQPDSVEHIDRDSEPVKPTAEGEHDQAPARRYCKVAPVPKGRWWQGADEDVTNDAATE